LSELRGVKQLSQERAGGKMFGRRKRTNRVSALYATGSDFCRIFEEDINRLYLLSFLLTGDRSIAEQCFVGGLHIAQEGNQVFKEWAESWARRAIIQNAIQMIGPWKAADDTHSTLVPATSDAPAQPAEIALIVSLPAFERFAFVMSVLERYSDQECSLLLGCAPPDAAAARTRALERLGRFAGRQGKLGSIGSNQNARRDNSESGPQLTAAPSNPISKQDYTKKVTVDVDEAQVVDMCIARTARVRRRTHVQNCRF
jgi:DNA-directed RNA polymerase specialized sigma24 family protein